MSSLFVSYQYVLDGSLIGRCSLLPDLTEPTCRDDVIEVIRILAEDVGVEPKTINLIWWRELSRKPRGRR